MKVLLRVFDGKVEVLNYEKEFDSIYKSGFEEGKEAGYTECVQDQLKYHKDDIEEARSDGYTKGYFDGKRDGEMSKKDIPEEVKKHLEEALSWLEN